MEVVYAVVYALGIGMLLAAALVVTAPWQADP